MTKRRPAHIALLLLVLAAATIVGTAFCFARGTHPVSGTRIGGVEGQRASGPGTR